MSAERSRLLPYAFVFGLVLQSVAAFGIDCKRIVADDVSFKLEKLGGYHQVSWIREHLQGYHNTTFKIDICSPLKFEDKDEKLRCGEGTHICGIETVHRDDTAIREGTWPIWREYVHDRAGSEAQLTRLKSSSSNADSQKEGLRIDVGGGRIEKKEQRAIIEFLCNKDQKSDSASTQGHALHTMERRNAAEGEDGGDENDKPKQPPPEWEAARKTEDGQGGSIEFLSYDEGADEDRLRLNWYTPFGCEDAANKGGSGDEGSSSGGWGFFSWFFFIIFMVLLAYLVFSAWINYTQHGARGWELLPHADTVRDVPYILSDWGRKIVSTLGGGGSRGGYSAV